MSRKAVNDETEIEMQMKSDPSKDGTWIMYDSAFVDCFVIGVDPHVFFPQEEGERERQKRDRRDSRERDLVWRRN